MLTLKRAEVERSLREEETRLRHIESRIAQIDRHGGTDGFDVILKSVEPTPFLSLQCSCADMDEVVRMVRLVAEDGARQIRPALRDKLIVVSRNDHDDEKLDLEIGFSLTRPSNAGVRLTGDYLLRASELPGGGKHGDAGQAGHQHGKPYVIRRYRHLDRSQQLPDRGTLPRSIPGADHRPARL